MYRITKFARVVLLAGVLALAGAACEADGTAPAGDPGAPADDPLAPGETGTETP